jgi:acetyltransferase-like isoleucine patch superfamily enzyme
VSVFIHPQGICESQTIGEGTRIWAFAHVLPGARIGRDCNICDHVFIENDVVVGDRTTIKCGVQLWDGTRVGDDVFIGPNATFINDRFPRSRKWQDIVLETVIENGAAIGANATVLPGIRIGKKAMVGAGAVVTHNVPPGAIVVGNPARITGYVDSSSFDLAKVDQVAWNNLEPGTRVALLGEAYLTVLPGFRDARGTLAVAEMAEVLPFPPERTFFVYNVPSQYVRGEHAHRVCQQFLICAHGSVSVVVDDGANRKEVVLDSPQAGLFIPPLIWATQYRYQSDSVLVVFASHPYDPADYIRDYDEFLELCGRPG